MTTQTMTELLGGTGIGPIPVRTQLLNHCASRIAQVFEKNHFPPMRIASRYPAMDYRRPDPTSSSWFIVIAAVLALATLAPMAVLASRLI
jgi:hypothetical protein